MNQNYEEGVFRTFEALKPELENTSVRIVAKALISKTDKFDLLDGETFEDLRKRFWEVDRTVFLRTLSKPDFVTLLEAKVNAGDREVEAAIERFGKMMLFLSEYVDKGNQQADNSFRKALKSTEVFITFETLKVSVKLRKVLLR